MTRRPALWDISLSLAVGRDNDHTRSDSFDKSARLSVVDCFDALLIKYNMNRYNMIQPLCSRQKNGNTDISANITSSEENE